MLCYLWASYNLALFKNKIYCWLITEIDSKAICDVLQHCQAGVPQLTAASGSTGTICLLFVWFAGRY